MSESEVEKPGVSGRSILIFTASFLTSLLIFLEFNPYAREVASSSRSVVDAQGSASSNETGEPTIFASIASHVPVLGDEISNRNEETQARTGASVVLSEIAQTRGYSLSQEEEFVEKWLSGDPFIYKGMNEIEYTLDTVSFQKDPLSFSSLSVSGFNDRAVGRAVFSKGVLLASSTGDLVQVGLSGESVRVITSDAYRSGQAWIGNEFGYGEELAWVYVPHEGENGEAVVGSLNARTWFWIEGRVQKLGAQSSQWYPGSDPVEMVRPALVPGGLWEKLIKGDVLHEPIGLIKADELIFRASSANEVYGLWQLNIETGSVILLDSWSLIKDNNDAN